MKIWFLRVMAWFSLRLRIYYAWSRVFQWLYEKRKWSQVTIPLFPSFAEIEKITGTMEWYEDSWRELWDAISMPQAAYGKHLKGETSAKDCDDISSVAAYCLEQARQQVDLGKTVLEVGLLTCPWVLQATGKTGGHNVCAFSYRDNGDVKWAWISNWFDGRIQWGLDSKEDIIRAMVGTRAIPIGWAFARVSLKKEKMKLKPTEYHWSLKS